MKPTQLKSGAWRIKVYVGRDETGKQKFISITRNSKMECLRDAAEAALHRQEITERNPQNFTVAEAIQDYLDNRSNILSPSTIRDYTYVKNNNLQSIMNVRLDKLTSSMMQKAVNLEAKTKAPKSVKNAYGVVSVVLNFYCDRRLKVTLPTPQKRIPNVLTEEQTAILIKALQGHPCEVPLLLALMLGLRRGEILGLRQEDYDRKNKRICIHRVMVETKERKYVEKATPKTQSSNRILSVPPYLADRIEELLDAGKPICSFSAARICKTLELVLEKNNLPKLTLHDLRRQNASIMLSLGIADKYAMERGGWATPHVMKSIYQMTMSDKRVSVDNTINNYFEQLAGSVTTNPQTVSTQE